jgi:hypothetical protein
MGEIQWKIDISRIQGALIEQAKVECLKIIAQELHDVNQELHDVNYNLQKRDE